MKLKPILLAAALGGLALMAAAPAGSAGRITGLMYGHGQTYAE